MGDLGNFTENQTIMYRELPLPEETEDQREKIMQLFRDNLELILDNSELIRNTPEYFFIRHRWALAGGAYVGAKYIPLGVLIMLWQSGEWLGECQKCGDKTYIFCAGGSPLSGAHYTNAVCSSCKTFVNEKKTGGLMLLLKPALTLYSNYSQKQKVLRTKSPIFTWDKGIEGKSEPDLVLQDIVQPVKLEVMIEKLLR